jgi:zona occludens toxin (predicted ATPase)
MIMQNAEKEVRSDNAETIKQKLNISAFCIIICYLSMIWMFTGTPGSGKSLHAARCILDASLRSQQVIANFAVKPTKKQIKQGKRPIFWDNTEITPRKLLTYAKIHHKKGKEGQTLLVIDECQIMFNCRAFNAKGRDDWVKFFSLHRHFGYDIILITQFDRMIDRQIRVMVEYQTIHRNVNNFRFIGLMLTLFRIKVFVAIELWYGMKEVNSKRFFRFHKKWANIYDSYANFKGFGDDVDEDGPAPADGGGGRGAPPPADGTAAETKHKSLMYLILGKRSASSGADGAGE